VQRRYPQAGADAGPLHSEKLFMLTVHLLELEPRCRSFIKSRHLVIITQSAPHETKAAMRERNPACACFLLIESDG
jgi:hypothetical protein